MWVRIERGARDSSLLQIVQTGLGGHPTSYSVSKMDPRREADHLYPSGAQVRNGWNCTSTPNVPSWPMRGQIYLYIRLQEKYH